MLKIIHIRVTVEGAVVSPLRFLASSAVIFIHRSAYGGERNPLVFRGHPLLTSLLPLLPAHALLQDTEAPRLSRSTDTSCQSPEPPSRLPTIL